jgi:hypothetical protein
LKVGLARDGWVVAFGGEGGGRAEGSREADEGNAEHDEDEGKPLVYMEMAWRASDVCKGKKREGQVKEEMDWSKRGWRR